VKTFKIQRHLYLRTAASAIKRGRRRLLFTGPTPLLGLVYCRRLRPWATDGRPQMSVPTSLVIYFFQLREVAKECRILFPDHHIVTAIHPYLALPHCDINTGGSRLPNWGWGNSPLLPLPYPPFPFPPLPFLSP